jgi:prephenate dehydrogenase
MNTPECLLAKRRVVIIGLGLMGGSLAMALRGHVAELFAIDPDPATRALAIERGIIDRMVEHLDEIISRVDVIILSAPVGVIIEQIRILGDMVRYSPELTRLKRSDYPILLDLGSTKQEIVEAMKTLPEQLDPIGGHPMCGKETSGLANADAAIYRGATFAFTPLERTSSQARSFAEALAVTVGSVPLWIDPITHDHQVAFTSHLPYLLANALTGVTPTEAAPLVGHGFRSTSRVAVASLPVWLDILRTNRQPVLEALHHFQRQLDTVEDLLMEGNYTALSEFLATAANHYQSLVQPL